MPTLRRVLDAVNQGQFGAVVSVAFRNLSGVNSALGATGSNTMYDAIGRIIAQHLSTLGANVILHQQGGEITIAIVGNSPELAAAASRAMTAARQQIDAYLANVQYVSPDGRQTLSLGQVPNPREPGDPGTGIDFGVVRVRPGEGTVDQQIGSLRDGARRLALVQRMTRRPDVPVAAGYNGPTVRR